MIEEDRGTVVRGICKRAFMVPGQESKLRKEVRICVCVEGGGW